MQPFKSDSLTKLRSLPQFLPSRAGFFPRPKRLRKVFQCYMVISTVFIPSLSSVDAGENKTRVLESQFCLISIMKDRDNHVIRNKKKTVQKTVTRHHGEK